MKAVALLACLLATAATMPAESTVSYKGHKVFRVPVVDDGAHIQSLIDRLGLSAWQPPSKKGSFADVQVAPGQLRAFEEALEGRSFEIMHRDLGDSIAREGSMHGYAAGSANASWFTSYHAYSDHLQWMSDIAAQYSGNVKSVTSGTTGDGNNITGLHIFGSSGGGKKPAVVFHGTVHAREWIVAMTLEYIANELITKYSSDSLIKDVVDKYDFYVFPVVNVDGFKYTQTSDRMWRKNRARNQGSGCLGTDPNRNWPYKWDGPGSSKNPCAESYRGTSAGSSPEVKSYIAFLDGIQKSQGVKVYIDWHSYSQLFMTPAPNNAALQALAKGASDAIEAVHGTAFAHGPICNVIYQVAGGSVDWVQDVLKADNVFTIELRDTGGYGFVLPPDQIIPSGEESFAGAMYLFQQMT
ncbi:carboxypeptidase [Metarhizium album ARSEF 1941]|uniref:Carboxypeptidase M14A n=1 Tax=Metarhizium album (strain ARSEF 1941) TaxID=1081103 RepID=A0A0B2WIP1_METAS|nr:carboxypeptidase [Metarhizium album ARSEF 1941]KHN93718.1 carboxypeptidase [Metarhizium album ARSEF 1941]